MFRITTSSARMLQRTHGNIIPRSLVTAAQKRALNKDQINGNKSTSTEIPGSGKSQANEGSSGPGGGGSGMIMGGAFVALAGGAIAYQQNLLPDIFGSNQSQPEAKVEEAVSETSTKVEQTPAEEEEKPATVNEDEGKSDLNAVEIPKVESAETSIEPNRVTLEDMALTFPPKVIRPPPVIPPVEHSPNANRISVERLNQNYPPYRAGLPKEENEEIVASETVGAAVESAEKQTESESVKASNSAPIAKEEPPISTTTAIETAKELQSSSTVDSSSDLHKAVLLLRQDLDQSYLDNLDTLSNTELKIRLIRMVNDMSDRGRFEAVRFKEMLDLKEKEISDKYLAILQQQRHQFEDLLSNRLREQEDALKRQTTSLLQEKDDSIRSLLEVSTNAQKAEHDAELKASLQQLEKELLLKKEAEYNEALATEKEKYTIELNEHVQQIQALSKAVQNLQDVALASQSFQTSSQKAHTISAAALALSNKLDTCEPLGEELATLRAVIADKDTVIQSTLEKIPKTASTKGIPTLSMLQQRFEHVWEMAQTAAHVPVNQVGMGAQLVGKVFSSLKYNVPITDESEYPSGEEDVEVILSTAKFKVERGELDKAIDLLKKLDGKSQVGFTVKDWLNDAKDRVVLEKALKVVKMECALLNENMAKE